MTDKPTDGHHLVIYSPDGIAISHVYEDEVIDQLADVISGVASVAGRQGYISTAEIVDAAKYIMENLKKGVKNEN